MASPEQVTLTPTFRQQMLTQFCRGNNISREIYILFEDYFCEEASEVLAGETLAFKINCSYWILFQFRQPFSGQLNQKSSN